MKLEEYCEIFFEFVGMLFIAFISLMLFLFGLTLRVLLIALFILFVMVVVGLMFGYMPSEIIKNIFGWML